MGCPLSSSKELQVRIRKYVPWWVVVAAFIISLPVRLVAYALDRWRVR